MAGSVNSADVREERTLLEGIIHYLTVVFRFRWLVVIGTATTALIAVGFSILSLRLPPDRSPLPNMYTASAVILMQRESGTDLDAALKAVGLAPTGESAGVDYAQLAVRVVRSRVVIDTLADEFGLTRKFASQASPRSGSRQAILAGLIVSYDKTSGALTLGFQSTDAQFSHDVLKRMLELLDEWFVTRGGTTRLKQKMVLEEKLADVSVEISQLEGQIKEFQERYGGLTVSEIAASQQKILDGLRSQLLLKEMEIQNYTSFVKIEDPNLARMKSERDSIREQIAQVESGSAHPGGAIMPARQDLPELALRFENLNRALQIQKGIYQALSQQYELVKLYLQSQPAFQILEPPEVPDRKSGPGRAGICMAASVIAFFLSVAYALVIHGVVRFSREPGILQKLGRRTA